MAKRMEKQMLILERKLETEWFVELVAKYAAKYFPEYYVGYSISKDDVRLWVDNYNRDARLSVRALIKKVIRKLQSL